MNKIKISIILSVFCILLSGCESNSNEELEKNISSTIDIDDDGASLVCTTDYDYTELNYTLGSKYVVFADKDGKVTKVISKEIISSTDKDKLDEFETYLTQNHSSASAYSGYDYNVEKEKNKVTSEVTIDYSEFDLKRFVEDNSSNTNEKIEELTLDSIEKQYVSLGAECKRMNSTSDSNKK